jgi:hypothetical protein
MEHQRPSCRACWPNAPFAQLVKLSSMSIADEVRLEHSGECLASEIDEPAFR